ncbi:condensation domain-containing protein [Solwaraspora sp. WMMA2056]|uniref:condensation domain-containing protein n=1 Tax=Solwaraspora sp. WMMA2056 TaxID=3015161 RepID=UPI00259B9B18|nr:condensation domain-containing protein [Solwaraspora sp. WMMA2056]WJK38697.1 condensation domain-containing protein [Solwaraspora sp. WMMA2056]
MTFDELLEHLAVHDVRLTGTGDVLHYDAPAAASGPELVAALRSYKGELLRWLTAPADEREVTRAPLSAQQERVMEVAARSAHPASWNVGLRMELVGELDVAALDAALDGLVARHHALRARLACDGGAWTQRILAHRSVPLPIVELTALAPDAARRRAEVVCQELVATAFTPAHDAPVRYALIRLAPGESWLVLVLHHVACDGRAVTVLLRELAVGYRTARDHGSPDFGPPAATQCTDYARWQQGQWDESTRRRRLAYWAEHLGDGPLALELPFDRPAPRQPSGQAATCRFEIPRPVRSAVETLARDRGVTVTAVTAAALALLFARLSGQPDVTLSMPYANRSPQAYEDTVTVLATALPVRIRTGAAATFAQLVGQAADGLFAGIDNLLPTAWIYQQLATAGRDAAPAGMTVSFAFQSTFDTRIDLPDLTVQVHEVPAGVGRTALIIALVPGPDGIDGYLEYPVDRIADGTARRWMAGYVDLLATACGGAHHPLADLRGSLV